MFRTLLTWLLLLNYLLVVGVGLLVSRPPEPLFTAAHPYVHSKECQQRNYLRLVLRALQRRPARGAPQVAYRYRPALPGPAQGAGCAFPYPPSGRASCFSGWLASGCAPGPGPGAAARQPKRPRLPPAPTRLKLRAPGGRPAAGVPACGRAAARGLVVSRPCRWLRLDGHSRPGY